MFCRVARNVYILWVECLIILQSSNFTPQVKEARNQSQIFFRKSI